MAESRYCLDCGGDGELKPCDWDEAFLVCSACGKPHSIDILDELEERQKQKGAFGDLACAYWDDVHRDAGGGGGDDGHRYVPDRPIADETLAGIVYESYRRDGTNIQASTIEASSDEARAAMCYWIENPPTPEEVEALKAEFRENQAGRRQARVKLKSILQELRQKREEADGRDPG